MSRGDVGGDRQGVIFVCAVVSAAPEQGLPAKLTDGVNQGSTPNESAHIPRPPTAIATSALSALGGCLELLLFVLYTPGLAPVRGLFRLFAFSFEGILLKKVAPVVLHGFWFRSEQIRRTQDEPQRIVAHRLLSHLQYLDSVKSSAKDLSLPRFEIMSSCKTFDGKSSSYATGSRPNACHVTMEAVDNTA